MAITRYTVVFAREGDEYGVWVPALPDVITSGETLEEASEMARDAIACTLEDLLDKKDSIPSDKTPREVENFIRTAEIPRSELKTKEIEVVFIEPSQLNVSPSNHVITAS